MVRISREEALYNVFSARLIEAGAVTERECDIIARRGTRKEYLWKRHLLDLAEYVLNNKKREEELCKQMIAWCKETQ